MNTNNRNIDIELISRFLSKEIRQDDEQKLKIWVESSEENQKLFEEYKSIWEEMDKVSSVASMDLDAEWKNLESRMEASGFEKPGIEKSGSAMFVVSRLAVAAVLVFALVIGGLYISRNVGYHEIVTAEGSEEILLPDGSSLTLNSYSSFKYPKNNKISWT